MQGGLLGRGGARRVRRRQLLLQRRVGPAQLGNLQPECLQLGGLHQSVGCRLSCC